ncbi:U3 snoRNP protein [Malassezia cuniculi]|uniref:U3 snoRNP protein n=1 Tax=Malassezia cuniculi TaxID=948313 RepID=A0AAF0J7I0_9BASI|nr:U3 snoRNP protein [Malassezia cuniculi]
MVRGAGGEDAELARLGAHLFGAPPPDRDVSLEAVADNELFAVDTVRDDANEAAEPETGGAKTRKAAWVDPDDERITVALAGREARAPDGSAKGTKRLRKLRTSAGETSVSGTEYQERLRAQFEKMHPRPLWAAPKEPAQSSSLQALLTRDGSLSSAKPAKGPLPPDRLLVERLRDANEAQGADTDSAAIEHLEFHPNARTNVLMTASRDRRVRLFHINGADNPLLESLHTADMPIKTAMFHPSGDTVLIGGPRPFLYAYNLRQGKVIRSSPWRGVGRVVSSVSGTEADAGAERDLSHVRFEPGARSRLVAIGGRRGLVHLLDWGSEASSMSGGQRVGELRMNAPLAGMAWAPDSRLLTLSTEGKVHVWDVRNQSCPVTAQDSGLFGAKGFEISPESSVHDAPYWSIGSSSGIVNVYGGHNTEGDDKATSGNELRALLSGTGDVKLTARRSIGNLTTATTCIRFSSDAQVLALASRTKKDALRMVHLPTLRVFSNWPTSSTPLGHVTAIDFTRNNEYAAIGNSRGRVLLYGLRHYM